jgi:hypothetical protein
MELDGRLEYEKHAQIDMIINFVIKYAGKL